MKAFRQGLLLNLALTSILLLATVTEPDPSGMWEFWHGLVVRLPAHVLRGAHLIWDVATPLW